MKGILYPVFSKTLNLHYAALSCIASDFILKHFNLGVLVFGLKETVSL